MAYFNVACVSGRGPNLHCSLLLKHLEYAMTIVLFPLFVNAFHSRFSDVSESLNYRSAKKCLIIGYKHSSSISFSLRSSSVGKCKSSVNASKKYFIRSRTLGPTPSRFRPKTKHLISLFCFNTLHRLSSASARNYCPSSAKCMSPFSDANEFCSWLN